MAGLNPRFALAAILSPLLFLAMSGWARANIIVVNTTDGVSEPAPLCSLPDAVDAHNTLTMTNGCTAGSGSDLILFEVTGTITIDAPLEVMNGTLIIVGSPTGCSGAGPCGITINGGGSTELLSADIGTTVELAILTFANGFAGPTTSGEGGAIFADGAELDIFDCLFVGNEAEHTSPGGKGGAIFINSAGEVDITNSTFTENTAAGSGGVGGAIADMNLSSTLKLTNVTIDGNTAAGAGGGYASMVSPLAKSTIFANNAPQNCETVPVTNVGTYNISKDASCGATHVEDPLLDPAGPKNNGGPTDTIALEPGSPAINLIPVADCTDQSGDTLRTDQRLFARPDPANLDFCDSGAYEFDAEAPIVLNSEKIEIARSSSAHSDQVNMNLTFTDNGPGVGMLCDSSTDAFSFIIVELFEGTCASIPSAGLELELDNFVTHTINGQAYGTLFQSDPPFTLQQPTETVSARMVALPTPADACGKWELNLEVAGLDTSDASTVNLGGGNPFALLIEDLAGNTGCFDVDNAIVGGQITPPGGKTRRVRRGARR